MSMLLTLHHPVLVTGCPCGDSRPKRPVAVMPRTIAACGGYRTGQWDDCVTANCTRRSGLRRWGHAGVCVLCPRKGAGMVSNPSEARLARNAGRPTEHDNITWKEYQRPAGLCLASCRRKDKRLRFAPSIAHEARWPRRGLYAPACCAQGAGADLPRPPHYNRPTWIRGFLCD